MLKKIVSLIVGIACMVSMTGVFAATYQGTTTKYVSDGTIQVETTITGGEAEQVATYLVYKEELESVTAIDSGADIVYIDAYEFTGADGGSYTFTYRTDSSNVGAKIAMGADVTLSDVPTVDGITVVYNEVTQATKMDPLPEDADAEEWVLIPCAATGTVSDVKISSTESGLSTATALADGEYFEGAGGIWVKDTSIPTDINTIYVSATEENATLALATLGMTYISAAADEGGENADSVVVVGQVVGNASEFGIILGNSADAVNNYTEDTTDVQKLQAFGKNADGNFAIRVYDTDGFEDEALYAVTYCKVDGAYQFAENGKWK